MNLSLEQLISSDTATSKSVFSKSLDIPTPFFDLLPNNVKSLADTMLTMNGLELLARLPDNCTPLAFFDPQYRGVMDSLQYGNEGARQKGRALLLQMPEAIIVTFISEIARTLTPSGHLMLWIDKFHLVEGVNSWLENLPLKTVDLITWNKGKMGMGYRTRRQSEYLLVLQKLPLRAKGKWSSHDIPDSWLEKITQSRKKHPHAKPEQLQSALINATTVKGDFVLDPAAGGFSVMRAAHSVGRKFIGSDLGIDNGAS